MSTWASTGKAIKPHRMAVHQGPGRGLALGPDPLPVIDLPGTQPPGDPSILDRHSVLVLHGDPLSDAEIDEIRGLAERDAVVAADGAAAQLMAAGIVPDRIVGDLDGLGEDLAARARTRGAQVERLPRDKAQTDGALALERVLTLAPDRVTVYGATGGRLAMTLANLQDLSKLRRQGVKVRVSAGREELFFLGTREELIIDEAAGGVFNVLAWQRSVRVTISGARYEAEDLALEPLAGAGVSNEPLGEPTRIVVHEGIVLVTIERAR